MHPSVNSLTGRLFLVPTPIGNLDDITLRALLVLKACDVILAEDTRTTGVLLKHHGIDKSLQAFHAHNEHAMLPKVMRWLEEGKTIAQVSDAGTPGISDPGFLLARACAERNMYCSALPGPSAILPALTMSGFPCDRFHFEGFLPLKKGKQTRLLMLSKLADTVALYESPHRLVKTLELMASPEFFGADRLAAIIREISKMHETVHRGTLAELLTYFKHTPPKGEIVMVINGYEE